jgi:hypothetical protein
MGARELAKEDVVLLVPAIEAAIEQTLPPQFQFSVVGHFPTGLRKKGRSI